MADKVGLIADLKMETDESQVKDQIRNVEKTFEDQPIELGVEIPQDKLAQAQRRAARGTVAQGPTQGGGIPTGRIKRGAKRAGKFGLHVAGAKLARKAGIPTTIPSTDMFAGGGGGGSGGGGLRTDVQQKQLEVQREILDQLVVFNDIFGDGGRGGGGGGRGGLAGVTASITKLMGGGATTAGVGAGIAGSLGLGAMLGKMTPNQAGTGFKTGPAQQTGPLGIQVPGGPGGGGGGEPMQLPGPDQWDLPQAQQWSLPGVEKWNLPNLEQAFSFLPGINGDDGKQTTETKDADQVRKERAQKAGKNVGPGPGNLGIPGAPGAGLRDRFTKRRGIDTPPAPTAETEGKRFRNRAKGNKGSSMSVDVSNNTTVDVSGLRDIRKEIEAMKDQAVEEAVSEIERMIKGRGRIL